MEDNQLAIRKRKALYRATHRGIKETDIVLGEFVHQEVEGFSSTELDELDILMSAQDWDIYYWVTGDQPVPAAFNNSITRRMIAHASKS